jgi:TRAP-type mannitol/chloroaromatic compound transport system permease large subunit
MGTAIQIEMALDQAKRFEDELQLLFMQSGKIDVWNKIKSRAAAMDVEAAHDARREKEAAERHKKELEDLVETVLLVTLLIVVVLGTIWGTYELVTHCKSVGCGYR